MLIVKDTIQKDNPIVFKATAEYVDVILMGKANTLEEARQNLKELVQAKSESI